MEAVALGALLNVLASNLPKVWECIDRRQKTRVKVELQSEIDFMQSELEMLVGKIEDHHSWGIHITGERSINFKRICNFAQEFEDCIAQFLAGGADPEMFLDKIKLIKGNFKGALDEKALDSFFKSDEGAAAATSPAPPDEHILQPELVGMEKPLDELEGLVLPCGAESERELKVISIVGFGGLGKTLLARQFYKKDKVAREFCPRSWVGAADKDAEVVLTEILKQVDDELSRGLGQRIFNSLPLFCSLVFLTVLRWFSVSTLWCCVFTLLFLMVLMGEPDGASTSNTVKINSRLRNKRYLIVIDDLRTTEQWKTIESAFPRGHVGSRIIVTTTIQSVANHCSSHNGHVYKMRTLGDKDSEKLFFNEFSSDEQSDSVKRDSSTLLKKCDGLPLALISTAQYLKGKQLRTTEWKDACKNLCAPEKGDGFERMHWVLMNKYISLSGPGLKACLLYFHMFPCDNPTGSKFLIRRWLAEGLVKIEDAFSDLDSAVKNLNTLIDRSIIRSMQVSKNAIVKSCRPPGMMLEFISRMSMSQNFITMYCGGSPREGGPADPKYVRRLSLHDGAAETAICITDVDLSLVRTLEVSGKACGAILNFENYKLLRVLDLKECDYQFNAKHLRNICELVVLKYLSLAGGIDKVPRAIKDLEQLETLDLGRKNIVEVYGEVVKLPRLKQLLGKFSLSTHDSPDKEVKKFFPEQSRLEVLSGFVTKQSQAFPQLMEHMKQLRKVKMWCDFTADQTDLTHLSTAIEVFIGKGLNDPNVHRSLSIDVDKCQVQFLESLNAPGRLHKLKLHGRLHRFPAFVSQLTAIVELCLSSTTLSWDIIQTGLGRFACKLRYLKLVELNLGDLEIQHQHFESLERLCLVCTTSPKLTFQAKALRFLVQLHMICKNLGDLAGVQIGLPGRLKEIALDSGATDETKDYWQKAAKGHPNRPDVLFV